MRMPPVLLAFVLACTGGAQRSPGTGTADDFPDMSGPSAVTSFALARLPGEYDLGQPNLPDDLSDSFTLTLEEIPNPKHVARKLKVLRAKLPFPVSSEDQRFAPIGLTIEMDGEVVPFSRQKAAMTATATWRVAGKHIVLAYPTLAKEMTVRYAGISDSIKRHNPRESGLSAEEFVAYDLTLDKVTRHGMILPAPSTASWTLDLPDSDSAHFETWLALEAPALSTPKPDGTTIVVSVVNGAEVTELARKKLVPGTKNFVKFTADLSAYTGKEITLRLSSEVGGNSNFDWAFLGSPTVWAAPKDDVRRVIVLAMDTTRPDHFGVNGYEGGGTPNMDRIAGESAVFENTWSVAPRTRPSFRSATTGRLPLDAVGATNLGVTFQAQGFATAGIVANVHLQPRFDFDHGFDWWNYEGKNDAEDQVDLALQWLGNHNDRDTFLFLHFMDPHLPYNAPGDFESMYVTDPDDTLPAKYNRWDVNKWSHADKATDQRKAHIEARHDGEMTYMDQELGRLFTELDKLPGKTLVVIHSDHGEEFWDHGGFEHNHTLYDEVTRTVLWVRPGGGLKYAHRVATPASLMDIAPTLYSVLGLSDAPETDGKSLVPWFDGADEGDWSRPIPIAYLQYEREAWAVVLDGHKYILTTGTGREELYKLADDVGEENDLSASGVDLTPWQNALGEAHHLPVKPGLRLFVDAEADSGAITVTLPTKATAADVLDPDATLPHRANLEWGETPKRLPADIGTVALSDDGLTLTYAPGPSPKDGVLWVQFEQAVDAAAVTVSTPAALRVEAGPVLVPPPSEMSRMLALRAKVDVDAAERALLEELGYIEGDH
ncbi:MAG: sulfatase-like hydrolase/transferase [Rhodobacterales bacterium]|nr:sulfatase-like hydrolase/transferase [Rhodobacterales bacterium]